jgi:hypothetical protein
MAEVKVLSIELTAIIMADRKCEMCGGLNRPLSSFIYDAE